MEEKTKPHAERIFDTKVQHLRYKVLREVARLAWRDELLENILNVPARIVPGKVPTMRCCVYKERAIIAERVKLAMGGDPDNPNVIEIIDIACDECPVGGYEATDACRSCLAHRCEDVCRKGAITFDSQQKAHIDKTKCVECGLCAKVCPYSAIVNHSRPCEQACRVRAISMSDTKAARIDNAKCNACGACVYRCPWGAINEKSYILDVIRMLRDDSAPVVAIVAPAIASQFAYAKLGQIVAGIRALGFDAVEEVALGADEVAWEEAAELAEKGFLMSSCCPAFVSTVRAQFPAMAKHLSHRLSPAGTLARRVRQARPEAKIVFIGPCTAKKTEFQRDDTAPYIDSALTFEELQALFDSRELDIASLPGEALDRASAYGRGFARSGGVAGAVAQALRERGLDFEIRPVCCDGIEACRAALLKASKGALDGNFIEGMACVGGCIGGAGCLTHGAANRADIDRYGREAAAQTIRDALDGE